MSTSISQKKIGVLTSGGDAPGMNAAIRAVVRTAVYHNIKVLGIKRGYDGLLSGAIDELTPRSVSDTIHKGGTILKTARCEEMLTAEGRDRAAEICKILGLNAVVVIGGDGSMRGAYELSKRGVNTITIPATIDLDMTCTDYTIGFDTAVNTGMEAINKIRDTSGSHERCSIVEVMGRNAGFLALWCGITGGAEEVMVPEVTDLTQDLVVKQIIENRAKGKNHNLIVVAEGVGKAAELAKYIEKVTGIETRATILGHLQRGGAPSARDRMHASVMGFVAIEAIIKNERNRAVVYNGGKHITIDLNEALCRERDYDNSMYEMIKILAI